jgi:hypothetical protein
MWYVRFKPLWRRSLSWIIWVDPKHNHIYIYILIRERQFWDRYIHREETHRRWEGDGMWLQIKEHLEPLEAEQGKERINFFYFKPPTLWHYLQQPQRTETNRLSLDIRGESYSFNPWHTKVRMLIHYLGGSSDVAVEWLETVHFINNTVKLFWFFYLEDNIV